MIKTILLRIACVCLLLAAAGGCQNRNPLGRQAVSGRVTLAGRPLDQGSIQFSPLQSGGVSSGGLIVAGEFSIPAEQGLPVGEYLVRVYSTDASGASVTPELPGPGIRTQPERIPPAYNARSEVRFPVVSDGANRLELDITRQK